MKRLVCCLILLMAAATAFAPAAVQSQAGPPNLIISYDISRSMNPYQVEGHNVYTDAATHQRLMDAIGQLFFSDMGSTDSLPADQYRWELSYGPPRLPLPLADQPVSAVAFGFHGPQFEPQIISQFDEASGANAHQWLRSIVPTDFPGDETDFDKAAGMAARLIGGPAGTRSRPIYWVVVSDGNLDVREGITAGSGMGRLRACGALQDVLTFEIPNPVPNTSGNRHHPTALRVFVKRIFSLDYPRLRVVEPQTSALQFPPSQASQEHRLPVTITNEGGGRLVGAARTTARFTVTNGAQYDIGPGERHVLDVVFTPQATDEGPIEGMLALLGGGGWVIDLQGTALPGVVAGGPEFQLPATAAFPPAGHDREVLSISNIGTRRFTGNVSLRGENPDAFTYTGPASPSLGPQEFVSFEIVAASAEQREHSATLVFDGEGGGEVLLSRAAAPAPPPPPPRVDPFAVETSSLTFEGEAGVEHEQQLGISLGTSTLRTVRATVDEEDTSGAFTIGNLQGQGLDGATLPVRFRLDQPGQASAVLLVEAENASPQRVALQGSAAPRLTLDPAGPVLNFPTVHLGSSAEQEITIASQSAQPIDLVVETEPGSFTVGGGNSFTLPPQGRHVVRVSFAPSSAEEHASALTLREAGGGPVLGQLRLAGTGSRPFQWGLLLWLLAILAVVAAVAFKPRMSRFKLSVVTDEKDATPLEKKVLLKPGQALEFAKEPEKKGSVLWPEVIAPRTMIRNQWKLVTRPYLVRNAGQAKERSIQLRNSSTHEIELENGRIARLTFKIDNSPTPSIDGNGGGKPQAGPKLDAPKPEKRRTGSGHRLA